MSEAMSIIGSEPEFGRAGEPGLVIRIDPKSGDRSFDHLEWGLIPHDAKSSLGAPRPLWARAETVAAHTMFADAFQRRRAIVPAKEYFQRDPAGRRYAISLLDTTRSMAWAGLWEGWRGPSGNVIRSYCVITVEASADIAHIHGRMPLVLDDADLPVWLGEEPGDVGALLRPPPAGILAARSMSKGR